MPAPPETERGPSGPVCAGCGALNAAAALFCNHCGTPLSADTGAAVPPRPARARVTALDAPNGAVVAAAAVAFLIMVVGGIVVWVQGGRTPAAPAGTVSPGVVAPPQVAQVPPELTAQPPAGASAAQPQPAAPGAVAPPGQAGPVYYFGPNPMQPPPSAPVQRVLPPTGGEPPRTSLPPAQVVFPPRSASGAPPAASTGAAPTVHLPDNGLGASELGAPPLIDRSVSVNPPATGGRVTLEIEGGGAPPGAGGGATGEVRPVDMGSQQQLQAARRLQMQGSYRPALRAYIKALDGAGDAAAEIHQQMGLCHQRLDERESAITRYTEAIALYRAQMAAGRNVEAAQRGIRACEAGIKASQ